MTIGIVLVAFLAAWDAIVPLATMQSTLRRPDLLQARVADLPCFCEDATR
jgi:hypothetical protein